MKQVDGRWVEVNGIPIFDSMTEVVQPRHTALVVIDMQNDFVQKQQAFQPIKPTPSF